MNDTKGRLIIEGMYVRGFFHSRSFINLRMIRVNGIVMKCYRRLCVVDEDTGKSYRLDKFKDRFSNKSQIEII